MGTLSCRSAAEGLEGGAGTTRVTIVREPSDRTAVAPPVTWATGRLRDTLERRGIDVTVAADGPHQRDGRVVTVAGRGGGAEAVLAEADVSPPDVPEAFAIVPTTTDGEGDLVLCGADERGLVYVILELADRAEHADDPLRAFPREPVVERPANEVRSVTRLFCSEVEDQAWFRDESFWDRYLSMLVAQRFNRFSLTLGLGYNYHRGVTDAYLYFPYPFLVSVPGYDVRVPQLDDEERARNLEALRSMSERARSRGLDFQLGLWNHAYDWIDSPDAHQTVEGLTPERHAAYCRDAVGVLLDECPAIGGLTFRVHGEGGIREGSLDFWRTVFAGVAGAGRPVGIDLHAKGLDEPTLQLALDTGQAVTVSPKFWAEHMGLGYHQAAIRESERLVRPDPRDRSEWHSYMGVSEGSRPFTRYGYADFLREGRGYDVVFRLWAGTQRVLTWGDPKMASAYGRAAHVAGAQGMEWCEPLTFKGREGSGTTGPRTGYRDGSMIPPDDWQKFAYAYRLFGRLLYDPDADPDGWRRALPALPGIETALASASRILPLVTVAHHPSASNNYFWPELYTDMPIVWTDRGTRPHPYFDTPEPHRFGNVGPLDPEVFSSVVDLVRETLSSDPSGRLSPLDVAARLDRLADDASRGSVPVDDDDVELRRWRADIAILAGLGRFFAGKLRAAVWYELFARTGDPDAVDRALDAYRAGRNAWADMIEPASVYVDDLTFGPEQRLRGHWKDRLAAIDADLADMEARSTSTPSVTSDRSSESLLAATSAKPEGTYIDHDPPASFTPGEPVEVTLVLRGGPTSRVELRYRPMNQALPIASAPMEATGEVFVGRIPAAAADGTFPLAYAFVIRDDTRAWRYPSLGEDLASQPYHVIRPASA